MWGQETGRGDRYLEITIGAHDPGRRGIGLATHEAFVLDSPARGRILGFRLAPGGESDRRGSVP
jgi:hypothetical protein